MLSNMFAKAAIRKPTMMVARPLAYFSALPTYENILVEKQDTGVALVTLNRPKALNALCYALFEDLNDAMRKLDTDPEVKAIVLTGSERAFAAGADIKEMQPRQYPDTYMTDMLTWWDQLTKLKTPLIGAVNGYALGGGSELAMMCDILIAGEEAKFGQPEVNLGVIPGMGGTQRLTRAIGKSRAMELCLTGDMMGADEAASRGLVSRVVPVDQLVPEAIKIGVKIAKKSSPSISLAKECVNQAEELGLAQGLLYERRVFQSLFATQDQKEGMAAFSEKRKPEWTQQ
eukprot:Macronucleus_1283.p1 GENE.Macronucleus_1283~~Macronucleus_1283.p1  ORF type:complete len:287 (+),score=135.93 Macronucleus_1283:1-861(+)